MIKQYNRGWPAIIGAANWVNSKNHLLGDHVERYHGFHTISMVFHYILYIACGLKVLSRKALVSPGNDDQMILYE